MRPGNGSGTVAAALLTRIRRWLQFQVERFLLGGAVYRLLFIVLCIGALSAISGLLLSWLERGPVRLEAGESIWWAFLRLSDPGYLGDDEGSIRRVISTILTVLGYVLFLGALVATMTQGLNDQIRRLERGFTPVAMKNHIVVLGWNASTPELLRELTQSENSMHGFLRRYGLRGMRIAVLAEEVGPELEQTLRERLGDSYNRAITVLRSGSALQPHHLDRVDFRNAAVVVFSPPEQLRDADEASDDAQLAKAIVTLRRQLRKEDDAPIVIASVADPLKLELLRRSYRVGCSQLISGTLVIARLMVRFVKQPGLNAVMAEIMSNRYGSELYSHSAQPWAGITYRRLQARLYHATVLGRIVHGDAVRPESGLVGARLPELEFAIAERTIEATDHFVVLANEYKLTSCPEFAPDAAEEPLRLPELRHRERTLLVFGWNHRSPWFLSELERATCDSWRVLVVSSVSMKERNVSLAQAGFSPQRMAVEHHVAETTVVLELQTVPLLEFDSILVMASDKLESAEDADARTLLVHQLLRGRLRDLGEDHFRILVELRDPSNEGLFERVDTEVIPSSVLLTHFLAQVALRPELRPVLDALLDETGPEIELHGVEALRLVGQRMQFAELLRRASKSGMTVLGVRLVDGVSGESTLRLNPVPDESFTFGPADELVLMVNRQGVEGAAGVPSVSVSQ